LPRPAAVDDLRNLRKEIMQSNRPIGVFVVSLFLFAGTGIAAVTGFSLLWPGTFVDRLWTLNPAAYAEFASLGRVSGILLLVLGAATTIAGVSMLKGRRWGWMLAVVLFAINATGNAVRLFGSERLKNGVGLLIVGGFLFYLTRPETRNYFKKTS
jgi:uncharacterized membrane protein (UPF0136 family)